MVFRLAFIIALLSALPVQLVANEPPSIHPGCFDALFSNPMPTSMDVDRCNQEYQDFPAYDMLGLKQFSRPPSDAGVNRGTLGFERIASGDWTLFRLEDNAGGTGVFSSLVLARMEQEPETTRLVDIERIDLGDRCHYGLAGIGKTADGRLVAASSLTPAALFETLTTPVNQLPDTEENGKRLLQTIGSLEEQFTACPTCCIGTAFYAFSPVDRHWRLEDIELDGLEWLDQLDTPAFSHLIESLITIEPSGATSASDVYLPVASIGRPLFEALAEQHPDPFDVRRLQFWLKEAGYYWADNVDGLWGPGTAAALSSAATDLGIAPPHSPETIGRPQISRIVSAAIDNERRRLHPVDEAGLDASFQSFIQAVQKAVHDRDADAMADMASNNIMLGLGGAGGRETLREWLQGGLLWQDLVQATAMGAVRLGPDAFCLPYPTCVPSNELVRLDPIFTLAITQESAHLLSGPAETADVQKPLDYDLVEVIPDSASGPPAFYQVRLNDGTTGYIKSTDGYWLAGYTMTVARKPEGWRITAFYGGD